MITGYLGVLDALLDEGASHLSAPLLDLQAGFVLQQQLPDGGFRGRQGASDPYYTDFALRTLRLTGAPAEALQHCAAFMVAAPSPRDVVECFSLLNARRLLGHMGIDVRLDTGDMRAVVLRQSLHGGGFAVRWGGMVSAYQTFIAALCLEMLGEPFPSSEDAGTAITALQTLAGGFLGQPGDSAAQTNTTAAAVAALTLTGTLTPAIAEAACGYLASMQAGTGGLLAHADAPLADLLSTFTGLVTLALLDAHAALDLSALGRFVRACAQPEGGFSAYPDDPDADLEYTYYGLGAIALLRAIVADRPA